MHLNDDRPQARVGTKRITDDAAILKAAQGIRAAIFDVDGVLTDGRLYVDAHGESLKAFHVLDGHGLKLLTQCGIEPIVISGRDSAALRRRLADLGVRRVHVGQSDKLAVAERERSALTVAWSQIAVMGDDWPDLPLIERAGFSCAPPNAHAEVLARVHHVSERRGGDGAVRECCDLLLRAQGRYEGLLAQALTGASFHTLDNR